MKSENKSDIRFLSKNIRFLREGLNLSQEEFSFALGVGRDNITSYERGTTPKLPALIQMGKLFQITIEDLSEFNLDKILDFQAVGPKSFELRPKYDERGDIGEFYQSVVAYSHDRYTEGVQSDFELDMDRALTRWRSLQSAIRTFTVDEMYFVHLTCTPICPPNSKSIQIGGQIEAPLKDESIIEADAPLDDKSSQNSVRAHFIEIFELSSFEESDFFEIMLSRRESIALPATILTKKQRYFAVPVLSDCMNPTLQVNDILIISNSVRYTEKDGGVYVIVTKMNSVVSRVKRKLLDNETIECVFDNPAHPSMLIKDDDIVSVFEVHGKLSFNLSDNNAKTINLFNTLQDRIDAIETRLPPKQL